MVLGSIGLLGLVRLLGEEDQAGLVSLKTLNVDREALLREVLAAGVDGDADGGGIKLGDASSLKSNKVRLPRNYLDHVDILYMYLELSEREAAAQAGPAVILYGPDIHD